MMRYEIKELLGTGGMGQVYRAYDPRLDREVALKFLRGSEEEDVARLLREARAQASLEHSNVCQVYEVGRDGDKHFIAMQFVDGPTLDAAATGMSDRQKVEAMLAVADAVQAAHGRGLLHRDLKPGNVLVEHDAERGFTPYVVDFGLATDRDAPGITASGRFQGTPAYASPEQIRGPRERLDARADVYSLGAILYELLSGEAPYQGDSQVEILVQVLQRDAPRLDKVSPKTPRDLAAIVGKCLEKEPSRRYRSARALAADLARYLDGEPVLARPPSVAYQARKAIQRNPLLSLVIGAALLLGAVGSGKYAWDLKRERNVALTAQRESEEVSAFLVELFEAAGPRVAKGREMTALEVLEGGTAKIDGLADQPRIQARLRTTLGSVHRYLGRYETSAELLTAALSTLPEEPASAALEAKILNELATTRNLQSKYADAEQHYGQALVRATAAGDELQRGRALRGLAFVAKNLGRFRDSKEYFAQARDTVAGEVGADHPEMALVLNGLGSLAMDLGQAPEAEKHYRKALAIRSRSFGASDPRTLLTRYNVGYSLHQQEKYAEAAAEYEAVLEARERVLGPEHPHVASSLNALGALYWAWDRPEKTRHYLERALDIAQRSGGPRTNRTAVILGNLGELEWTTGRLEEAEEYYRRSLEIKEEIRGPRHPSNAYALHGLGNVLRDLGRSAEAERAYLSALRIRREVLPPDHPELRDTLAEYGALLRSLGRGAEAEALEREDEPPQPETSESGSQD